MYTIRQTQTHQLAWTQIHSIYRDRDRDRHRHRQADTKIFKECWTRTRYTKWKLDSYAVYVLLLVRPFMQILHLNHLEIKYNTSYDKIAIHSISYSKFLIHRTNCHIFYNSNSNTSYRWWLHSSKTNDINYGSFKLKMPINPYIDGVQHLTLHPKFNKSKGRGANNYKSKLWLCFNCIKSYILQTSNVFHA